MPTKTTKNQDELARRVAERVWQLWQADLRRERERRGKSRKGVKR